VKEWQVRQEVYRRLKDITKDDLNRVEITWAPDTIIPDAIKHFYERVDKWIYPAKSYFVAICYANWIAEDFNETFYDVLSYPNLLPDDPYFKPYHEDPETYDAIIKEIDISHRDDGMVPDVYEYYLEELGD